MDREVRIQELLLARDGDAGESAAPRPRRLRQKEERGSRSVGCQKRSEIVFSDRRGIGKIELIVSISVQVEETIRRRHVEYILL